MGTKVCAAAFLTGFTGCLATDGYAGYNQVTGAVRCGCWSHMRRKWREAMPKGAESSAIVYTLAETAKTNGLDPHMYLLRLLEELPDRNPSQNDLDLFLPWQPAVQAACASSVSSKS